MYAALTFFQPFRTTGEKQRLLAQLHKFYARSIECAWSREVMIIRHNMRARNHRNVLDVYFLPHIYVRPCFTTSQNMLM